MAHSERAHSLLFASASGCRFCIRLGDIERLLPLVQLQIVPEAPDYLVGIMNLAGEPVPVIDLAKRLGCGSDRPYRLDNPVLLIKTQVHRAGLLVDDVLGIRDVPREALRGEALFREGLPPVLGAVVQDEGTALLLDTLRILDIDLSGLTQPLALGEDLLTLCQERVS
ncbi:MAG: CheW domain-containing protein [Betaproteobacteria bacterium]|nr:CheW domain-containing protein [Betaproteobacteria bacterium]